MSNISKFNFEIPFQKQKDRKYRLFEILPGFLTWTILILPFVLAYTNVGLAAIIMISYLLLWFVKAMVMNLRALQGYKIFAEHQKLDWQAMIVDLDQEDVEHRRFPKWHYNNKKRQADNPNGIYSKDIIHAVIVATWNEAYEILKPTLENVKDSLYDKKKMIVLLAYEDRGGEAVEKQAKRLMDEYKDVFLVSKAIKHIDLPGEVVGKGGNITATGRELQKIVEQLGIDPKDVLVTTLDADNRPHKSYFAGLSYVYAVCHDPKYMSFQPIPMFTNNIWDAPAPMRVIATGNSYWMLIQGLRQHSLRNFSAHAQPLHALIETDFWSTRTIVEDGHQFWRSWFAFDGKHEVIPIFLPIYQDAVLADTYKRTLKAQFIQIRRWAWGASDIAYVAKYAFFTKNKISYFDRAAKFGRLLEGHVSWSTSPLILLFGAILPWIFNQSDFLANQLPQVASRLQTVAMVGIFVSLFFSFKILPPRPERYKRHRNIFMVLQWVLLPLTTIVYSSSAAITSQTRLMFKRYLDKFDVTEKAVKKDSGETVTSHK
jgi:hypothetical protein